jgi:hypothetical protein
MRKFSVMIAVLAVALGVLLVSSAYTQAPATGANTTQPQATAKVIFYYDFPVGLHDCMEQVNIQIDGATVHAIGLWHVWQTDVAPGTHTFSDDSHKDKGLTATLTAGQTYYYAIKAIHKGFGLIPTCGSFCTKPFEMRSKEIQKATQLLGKPGVDETVQNVPPAQAAAQAQIAKPEPQKLLIESNPQAADIEVDGSFVGNTPSALELGPGEHTVVVTKSGYKPWQRKIKLLGGDIKLNAELEKIAPGQ